jgi:hypothetical protein
MVGSNITDKLTADQKEHIYEMTRDAHFVKTVARFSPETVGGVLSYNFTFDLDRAGINTYLTALKNYVNTVGNDSSALSAFDPTSINKSLDQIKNFNGEVWIGRSDKLLHKITLNFSVQPDPTKDEEVKITMVSIFSNWNQPVSIVAPDSSVPFETLISSLMTSSMTPTQQAVVASGQITAKQKGNEAAIKSNLDNMRTTAAMFYNSNNSYLGFCSSASVVSSRSYVENLGGTGFVCRDTATEFSIGVKLLTKISGNWCIDSAGASQTTVSLPTGTVCPAK